jgi:hypothetical protein
MTDTNGHQAVIPRELIGQIVAEIIDQGRTDRANDIAFGDQPNQAFTPMWAEGMLRELFSAHPQVVAACLTAYTTGIRGARRGRPAGSGDGS